MSKPLLLVFLLMIMIITSQFEWRQQIVNDLDTNTRDTQKLQQILKGEEGVKDKIILAQEREIQRLNELVVSLKERVQLCRINNLSSENESSDNETETTSNGALNSLAENIIELERQQTLED